MDPDNPNNPSPAPTAPPSPPVSKPTDVPPAPPTPPPPPASPAEAAKPKVIVSSAGRRNAFLVGALVVFLLAGLGASLFLVRRQPGEQDIRSKAAGCDARWPAKPDTACGTSTQLPAQAATNVSLTPDFHWDYGGYRPEDNGQCVQPSSCGTYAVSIYLMEGSGGAKPFARADAATQATPVKDMPFSAFRKCDYGNVFPNDPDTCHTDGQPAVGQLKPGTSYYWRVTPYFDNIVHAEHNWNYNFTTGSTTAACQMVSADKDLSSIKIDDTVTFSGWGMVSADTEKIDKINFIISKDGAAVSDTTVDTVRDTDKDSGTNRAWKGTQTFKVTEPGVYSVRIRVHWQSADQWFE